MNENNTHWCQCFIQYSVDRCVKCINFRRLHKNVRERSKLLNPIILFKLYMAYTPGQICFRLVVVSRSRFLLKCLRKVIYNKNLDMRHLKNLWKIPEKLYIKNQTVLVLYFNILTRYLRQKSIEGNLFVISCLIEICKGHYEKK